MRVLISVFLVSLMFSVPDKVLADDVALVISNDRSLNRDTNAVARAYRDDGFNVIFEDGRRSDRIRNALASFERESRDADRILIHYVGDTVKNGRSLFLKPSDYEQGSIVEKHYNAVSLELVYELLAHRPGRSAFILSSTSGAIVNKIRVGPHIPNGLMVMLGEGAQLNGVVRDVFMGRQHSGKRLNLRTDTTVLGFVSDQPFVSRNNLEATTFENNSGTAANAALVEMRVWRDAAQNGSKAALESYINRYPNGLFRGEADARLRALAPPKPIEQTLEESLQLSRADRRSIQQNLTSLGFNTRGVDGLFGPGTRSAIERWQRTEGFLASGFLDRAQIRVLNETAQAKAEADRIKREREDLAFWQQTGSGTNQKGIQDYLAKYPQGLFAAQAKQALSRVQPSNSDPVPNAVVQREKALKMNTQTRRLVEQRLVGLGYKPGAVDGKFTRETRIAIKAFQSKSGLPSTGYMDNQTVTRLVASIFR